MELKVDGRVERRRGELEAILRSVGATAIEDTGTIRCRLGRAFVVVRPEAGTVESPHLQIPKTGTLEERIRAAAEMAAEKDRAMSRSEEMAARERRERGEAAAMYRDAKPGARYFSVAIHVEDQKVARVDRALDGLIGRSVRLTQPLRFEGSYTDPIGGSRQFVDRVLSPGTKIRVSAVRGKTTSGAARTRLELEIGGGR